MREPTVPFIHLRCLCTFGPSALQGDPVCRIRMPQQWRGDCRDCCCCQACYCSSAARAGLRSWHPRIVRRLARLQALSDRWVVASSGFCESFIGLSCCCPAVCVHCFVSWCMCGQWGTLADNVLPVDAVRAMHVQTHRQDWRRHSQSADATVRLAYPRGCARVRVRVCACACHVKVAFVSHYTQDIILHPS